MMNDTPEEKPFDHPALSMELSPAQSADQPIQDTNVGLTVLTSDEESPMEEKRVVEPQLVLEGDIQSSNPAIKFRRGPGAKTLNKMSSTVIDIGLLPADLAEDLRPYDINGDGMISLTEIVHGAVMQQEQQQNVKFFRRLVVGFVVIWLLTMGAFFGVVYGAIEASKESKVDDNNNNKGGATLVTKDNAYVVQTANSDFFVGGDGSAYVRTVTSQDFESAEGSNSGDDDANYNVMKTSAAMANITFSSYMPDEILMELKTFSIRSIAGAHLNLQVHGVLRMPPAAVDRMGAVTIITHIGRIVIDGTAVSFYDDMEAAIFENAGFIVTEGTSVGGRRRRLLDGIQALFGIFNAVASLKSWTGTNSTYANIPPPKLPTNFVMHSRRFAPCVANPKNDGTTISYPGYTGGALPNDLGVDYCNLLQVDTTLLASTYNLNDTLLQRFIETEYVIYRVGSDYLRMEYIHPLHPEVTFVEVLDNSDPHNPVQFHYNVDTATKGLVVTAVSSDYDLVEFKGPIFYYNDSRVTEQNLVDQALSSPFEYMGTTSYQGADVRIWALHLMNNTLNAYWYDSVDTQQVQRIDYGDFGMLDVVGLTPLEDSQVVGMSYLFTRPITGVTKVITGNDTSANLPYHVGVNPYEPFMDEYRKNHPSESDGSRHMFDESVNIDGSAKYMKVPKELLIPDAEAIRQRYVPGTEKTPAPRSASIPAVPIVTTAAESSEQRVLSADEETAELEQQAQEATEQPSPIPTTTPFKPSKRHSLIAGIPPLQLPQIPSIPLDIAAISDSITGSFGCAVENKCNNYLLWYSTINAPFFPVLTATGNDQFPCVFSTAASVPVIVPVMPVIAIGVEAGVEIAFCNDYSALDYVLGTLSVSVGITGLDYMQPPFDQLFTWNVATVGIGLAFYKSETWCRVDEGVGVAYNSPDAYGLLRNIGSTSKGPQVCRCLQRQQNYPGLMYVFSGPDIPGMVLAPLFPVLSPLLAFTRITNNVMLENFPNVCELSISRTAMSVDIVMNLGMYTYTVSVISYQMSMATRSGDTKFVGAYMNRPAGVDPFISQEVFSERFINGAYDRAGNALIALVNRNAFIWLAVVRLGGTVADAAARYFAASVDGGQLLDSVAGEYATDLFKLFQPRPVVIQGCFNPTIKGPECTRKRRIFGRSFCVGWSMPEVRCGSTSQCIKYCR